MALLQSIDHGILTAASQLGGVTPTRDDVVFLLAEVLPYSFVVIAIALYFSGKTKRRRERNQNTVLVAALAAVLAIGTRFLIGHAIGRPRPFVTYPELHHLQTVSPHDVSFPSGHTMTLFAVAGTVFFIGHHPKLAWLMLFIAATVAVARVVAGVHYPSDVIGGAIFGLLLARLVSWQSRWVDEQVR